jgi:hypothetical protein
MQIYTISHSPELSFYFDRKFPMRLTGWAQLISNWHWHGRVALCEYFLCTCHDAACHARPLPWNIKDKRVRLLRLELWFYYR